MGSAVPGQFRIVFTCGKIDMVLKGGMRVRRLLNNLQNICIFTGIHRIHKTLVELHRARL